jgi:TPR repeat protein
MNVFARSWLSVILLAILVSLPSSASAGMTPEEVSQFEGYMSNAIKGDSEAQCRLGTCYLLGIGAAKDEVAAAAWHRKAADQGFADSQCFLGSHYADGRGVAKDEVEAVKWYRKAADQGDAGAQYFLGACYYGGRGVAKDEVETYAYYSLAGITLELARTSRAFLAGGMSPDARIRGQQRAIELGKEIEAKIAAKKAGK